jgi:hypothetical protein
MIHNSTSKMYPFPIILITFTALLVLFSILAITSASPTLTSVAEEEAAASPTATGTRGPNQNWSDFSQTCTKINLYENYLQAICPNIRGQTFHTSINLDNCISVSLEGNLIWLVG